MYVRGPRSQTDEPGQLPEPVFFNPEASSRTAAPDYANQSIKDIEARRQPQETQPQAPQKKKRFALSGTFTSQIASKSPIMALLLVLFGGAGMLGITLGPGMIMMHADEVLTKDLNSQLAGYSKTSTQLWRTKLKNINSGSCGAVKIACKFKTVNVQKTEKMFKRAGIQLEFDKSAGWGENRGKITKMTHTDQFGKTTTITSPGDLDKAMKSSPEFGKAMRSAYNPKFVSLKDTSAINFLKKMKTSYAKKLTGNTTKELDKNMTDAVSGKTAVSYTKLQPEKDKDGKETGRYIDKDGTVYDADTVRELKITEDRLRTVPSTKAMLHGLAKGALITSMADTACTMYKMSQAVQTAAKLIRQREEIRYAMVLHNTVGAMKAGDATPEQVEYLGKKISEPDMRKKIIDETAWNKANTTDNPPMIDNPNYRKSGLDSEFYKMSAYQDTPTITAQNGRFLAAGNGLDGTLSDVNKGIEKALGSTSPASIRSTCKVIQNPVVRGGSLLIGIAAGVGSFGWTTALGVGGALSFAFALPYLTAMLSEIVAGKVTGPELIGTDSIDATAVGTSAMLNGQARSHGMMALPPDKMAEYQNINREVQVAYANDEAYEARETPFDIYNQYSFLGSLARQFAPITVNTASSATAMLRVIPSTLGLAATALTPRSSAMSTQTVTADRYTQCEDPVYKQLGVAVDPSCVMVFGLPKEAMEIDPVDNALWMVNNDEIDPESETGAPKDNKRDWNYKKYLEDCVDQQPGAHENAEDENDDNGIGCVDPANFEKNWHYAKFKLSVDVSDSQDGIIPGIDGGSQDNFTDGESGSVSQSGWAYPTTADARVSSPFGPRGGSTHKGADLVPSGGAVGKPIFAARDGEVIAAGPASGFGNWIVITSTVDGKRYDTVYGHMFDDGVLVRVGDKVKAGQEIGKIGYNGQVSPPGPNGAHLHFEVWEDGHANFANGGHAIDPAPILRTAHDDNIATSTQVRL